MSKHGINLACVLKHPVNDNTANEVRRGLRLNGDYTKGKKMKCSLLFYIKKKKKVLVLSPSHPCPTIRHLLLVLLLFNLEQAVVVTEGSRVYLYKSKFSLVLL